MHVSVTISGLSRLFGDDLAGVLDVAGIATTLEIPRVIHRGEEELPFVSLGDGTHVQLFQVDFESGLWVVRTKFEAGVTIPTHKHTGEVFAFTLGGSWKYLEYPEVNTAGSYLYEPAGSIHTLTVPAENEGKPRPNVVGT